MTKEYYLEILNKLKPEDIRKIYFGRDRYCRCGCGGKYYSPEDEMFEKMLKKAIRKANKSDSEISNGSHHINISYDDGTQSGKAYTIYIFNRIPVEED